MIEDILAALIPQGNKVLNTKKIDKNIDTLLQYRWFEDLYDDEKYRELFFTNRKIRSYLESERRVNKIIENSTTKEKFVFLLNSELKIDANIR